MARSIASKHQHSDYTYFYDRRSEYLQMNKLTSLGKIAVGLVHDLANMTQYTLQHADNAQIDNIQNNHKNNEIQHTVQGVHDIARLVDATRKRISHEQELIWFSPAIETVHAKKLLDYKMRAQHIEISFSFEPHIALFGSPAQFYQCISNLLINAIEAYGTSSSSSLIAPVKNMPRKIVIKIRHASPYVIITIRDWAGGISKTKSRLIFKPFYTTKSPTKGLGLGLSLVKDIMKDTFHGKIVFHTLPKEGTTFGLLFPRWKLRQQRCMRNSKVQDSRNSSRNSLSADHRYSMLKEDAKRSTTNTRNTADESTANSTASAGVCSAPATNKRRNVALMGVTGTALQEA
ncbi:MAG: HAMP domain-containing sensor histidine kinase [Patescibacteria group bacterium]